MPSLIGVDVQGLEAVQNMLTGLVSPSIADEAADAVGVYLLDVLQTYPPQKSVSRAEAYPEVGGWFSKKQRRWFFAALNSGELQLPYQRTQTLRNNWQRIGQGASQIIVNETDYGTFVFGDSAGAGQSRMSSLIGWKTLPSIVAERQQRINEIVQGIVKRRVNRTS